MSGSLPFSMEGERQPLPPPEVIARLPADGGPEFNRLVFSKSPYLLQHARNPVDWHEWGPEAFELAAERDVPVFLSIGYSTCHWCHVMEHESFEDAEVAKLMNEAFVCIKVDREERPDIDQLYMTVTQALTGSGGWPMTIVMTPGKKPFFAGTYFPKDQLGQRAGMKQLVPGLSQAWRERRDDVLASANGITEQLAQMSGGPAGDMLGEEVLARAEEELRVTFDAKRGGFGSSRKFPVPHELRFLLGRHANDAEGQSLVMVEKTLRAWRMGGIFDHVGLGIHRYSTDPEWLAPHFEKMLYDQALCALAYVDAWRVTKDAAFERAAREILTYVARDMTSPGGGFYSAEDADSEGEEGLFYLWTLPEVRALLAEDDAAWVIERFRMTEPGNFRDEATGKTTGRNIPHLESLLTDAERERWEPLRQKLFASREARAHPLKDDKVLTDWNGLMIAAFAEAGAAFGDAALVGHAERAAAFLRANLLTKEGRLLKRWRGGEAGLQGMLEDHAFALMGFLALFEATHDPADLALAREIADTALEHFWDDEHGGFFLGPDDGEALIVRSKDFYDGARPSGNSVMATELLRLARMTGEMSYEKRAILTIRAGSLVVEQRPSSFTQMLAAVDFVTSRSREIVVVGSPESLETQGMLRLLAQRYAPNDVVILKVPGARGEALAKVAPYTESQIAPAGGVAAYVCEGFACKAPVVTAEALAELLAR
ncbi:thioredoxin domain-containing protein [Saltatorellus ferox]